MVNKMAPKIKEKFLKRRNFKARTNIKTKIDTTEQAKIKLVSNELTSLQYDESNPLVLPSEKRHTKKIHTTGPVKLLSKKHRKRLQKIVDTKKKKADREVVLGALEKMHASSKNMPMLTSLQATQTMGRKKFLLDSFDTDTAAAMTALKQQASVAGAGNSGQNNSISANFKRKRKEELVNAMKKHKPIKDPRVVTADSSSDTSSDSSDDDDIEVIKDQTEEENDEKTNGDDSESNSANGTENTSAIPEASDSTKTEDTLSTGGPTSANASAPVTVVISPSDRLPSTFVPVKRDPVMAEARQLLPILSEEQTVMEAIRENMMTVIVGPTGSGKTTQVPQFLYEAGYARGDQIIGVTEPRRVAAVSMAGRVGLELGLTSSQVSYQIRFEGNTTQDTKIKFMTDGVLLKELQHDPYLMKYSALVIDEAHERSVYSDMLIGALTRVAPARLKKGKPLKLIVMSATLRVSDFTDNAWLTRKMPAPPPVVKIEGRTYDVAVHYNKKTLDDYMTAALTKVCKIHRELPEGAILVFLTGKQEVDNLCRKLRMTFPQCRSPGTDDTAEDQPAEDAPAVPAYRKRVNEQRERRKRRKDRCKEEEEQEDDREQDNLRKKLLEVDVKDFVAAASVFPDIESEDKEEEEEEQQEDDQEPASDDDFELGEGDEGCDLLGAVQAKPGDKEQPLHVLPLYSVLSSERQKLVFQPPPPGSRLCVVATNVAETSLTIPDVKYVVDCGKTKEKVYDKVTGVSMFHVTNCSKASANQRAGRAGRVAHGHCYRLYSSAVFNEFAEFAKPEMVCRPIDDVVLLLKNLKMPVINFPYPTPPDPVQIRQSMKRLVYLGALEERDHSSTGVTEQAKSDARSNKPIEKDTTVITRLGRVMSSFPVAPRYAKMLCLSEQLNMWPYTIALVAALTVQEVLVEMPLDIKKGTTNELDDRRSEWRKIRLSWSGTGQRRLLGDLMVLLRAVLEADAHNNSQYYCDKYGLRQKGLLNIRKLRHQLTNEVNRIVPDVDIAMDPDMKAPSQDQCRLLRQVVLSGSVDRVARRVDTKQMKEAEDKLKWKHAYRTRELEEPVFLLNSSVLKIDKPEWVVYQDIFENSDTGKMFMRGVTAIEPEWLPNIAPQLCVFAEPLLKPAPHWDEKKDAVMCYTSATFGRPDWELPRCLVPYPASPTLYALFGYHFLKGNIFETLQPLENCLMDIGSLMRPMSNMCHKQREALTRALRLCDVTSKTKLLKVWKKCPTYLRNEYCLWLKDSSQAPAIYKVWPPITKENNEWVV